MATIQNIAVTTDANGDATAYSTPIEGRLFGFYHDGALDAGVDFTLTGETSGVPILTIADAGAAAAWRWPRLQVHNSANGVALTLDGLHKNVDEVYLRDYERIKIVVAGGGNALTGALKIVTDG